MADTLKYEEIIKRVINGETEAFDLIIEELAEKMLRLALTFTKDKRMAEEAVQDAFIDCYLHLRTISAPYSLDGYIAVCIKRRCFKNARAYTLEDISDYEEILSLCDDQPEELLIRTEDKLRVLEVIGKLSPALRETTKLFYIDGCSVNETAIRLGVPTGTVKRRLHDARGKLQKELMELMNELPNSSIEQDIREKIKKIDRYVSLYGANEEYSKSVKELSSIISDVENDRQRRYYETEQLRLFSYCTQSAEESKTIHEKLNKAAEAGENSKLLAEKYYMNAYELFWMGDNLPQKRVNYWLNTAIPALEKCKGLPDYEEAVGQLLLQALKAAATFDRDAAKRLAERALDCFCEEDFRRTRCKTMLDSYKISDERSAIPDMGVVNFSTRLTVTEKGLYASSANGYIYVDKIMQERTRCPDFVNMLVDKDFILLHAGAKAGDVFESGVGDSATSAKQNPPRGVDRCTVRYLDDGETLTVPAGTFEGCTHIRNERDDT